MDRRPAVHRIIVIVDVERFGDPRRTNWQQIGIREGLYRAVQDAFSNAGIPWDSCDHEDRGDGIFILVPAGVPKSLLAESLPPALAAALQDHNGKHRGQQPTRLRMVLHAGEVNYDEHGVTGKSVNLAFRLLDAPQPRAALARRAGLLAVIVSSWFFEDVTVRIWQCLEKGARRMSPPGARTLNDTAGRRGPKVVLRQQKSYKILSGLNVLVEQSPAG